MEIPKEYKVLYVINFTDPYGANKALLNILDSIRDYDVCPLVVMSFQGEICNELKIRNIEYKVIKHYFSIYPPSLCIRDLILYIPRLFRTVTTNFFALKKMSLLVNDFKPDIIHTNVGPDHLGFYTAIKHNVPHVWHIREYQDLYFNMRPLFSMNGFIKKLQNGNNYSLAITNALFKHYSMNKNARVICDGVMKANETQFESEKEKYFLFVGRLEEAKGVRVLIEAYIEFSKFNSDFNLLIAGWGNLNYMDELFQLVNKANLSSNVQFLGFRSDVSILMSKATALIVPSRNEGFGFITVEAMFNGCLVIGNNSGGTREILESENLGILYSGHNELVTALKTVVTNGIQSYYPLIKKAQERAVILYSQDQNVKAVFGFYQDILNQNRSYKNNVN